MPNAKTCCSGGMPTKPSSSRRPSSVFRRWSRRGGPGQNTAHQLTDSQYSSQWRQSSRRSCVSIGENRVQMGSWCQPEPGVFANGSWATGWPVPPPAKTRSPLARRFRQTIRIRFHGNRILQVGAIERRHIADEVGVSRSAESRAARESTFARLAFPRQKRRLLGHGLRLLVEHGGK